MHPLENIPRHPLHGWRMCALHSDGEQYRARARALMRAQGHETVGGNKGRGAGERAPRNTKKKGGG